MLPIAQYMFFGHLHERIVHFFSTQDTLGQ